MCVNTCLAYMGPFADLDICPMCLEPRYDQLILARPQIQALWRDLTSASNMRYHEERTQELIEELQLNDRALKSYDNFFAGSDYINAVAEGQIQSGDTVLMFSMDGAQLYEKKSSDCWIYIWVIFDLSPDKRYQKKHVLPDGIIPGPNKPKNIDSFIFPGLHHLSAIQREGLRIWDSSRNIIFTSKPFLALVEGRFGDQVD
ncbi:hypothetical protein SERLADRAFT_375149 [Serpula lacrymans var. lacrymans S7.9]|uniref:Uncharacterized protein n=1 Tax=Serpula lacrymans var. lacrymans (strain S7.9) TaxID=578457 RepID=F8PED3_SERL9|nr:uncharacterized protein SERLADRAFT_375149 [Serpula lacrymans var. lacrymans S7.9]EGO18520.1 hypothetical protein SERLADRAFT_375149 [Serpula lacrymans var. lacrymans S7.9]